MLRSTNLDQWSWTQLRLMKLGGNGAFGEYLSKHPSTHTASTDTKDVYTSRAALAYKDELNLKIGRDERESGGVGSRVIMEGVGIEQKQSEAKGEDFFDTWDKAPVVAPRTATPNVNLMSFGGSNGTTPIHSQPGTPRMGSPSLPAAPAVVAPRTVTSSSLRSASSTSTTSTARPKPLGTRLGAVPAASGRSKLGVKKVGAVNFEEAERKAKEDEERIKRLGYDTRLEAETAAAALGAKKSSTASSSRAEEKNGKTERKGDGETERLGMGIKRLGFGQTIGMSGEESARNAAAAEKLRVRRERGYDDEPGSFLLPFPRQS